MDPFHVLALVGSKLDTCRQRVQTEIHHRRGRKGDPLSQVRKTAKTRSSLITEKQWNRVAPVLLDDKYRRQIPRFHRRLGVLPAPDRG